MFVKKLLICFLLIWIVVNSASAQVNINLLGGYQFSNLNFSIAGTPEGTDPNVFSELKWTDVGQRSYGVALGVKFLKKLVVDVQANTLKIKSGNVSDIDYASDNRTDIFNKFYGTTRGFERNITANLGYQVFEIDKFSLVAMASYFGQFQKNYLLNGAGTNATSLPWLFIPNLNSYYRTNWNGFGPLVSVKFKFLEALVARGTFAMYKVKNEGYGRWNTKENFAQPKSYLHSAKGYSFSAGIDLKYIYQNHYQLGVVTNYRYSIAKNGADQLLLANGNVSTTRLNEVEFNSVSFALALGIQF